MNRTKTRLNYNIPKFIYRAFIKMFLLHYTVPFFKWWLLVVANFCINLFDSQYFTAESVETRYLKLSVNILFSLSKNRGCSRWTIEKTLSKNSSFYWVYRCTVHFFYCSYLGSREKDQKKVFEYYSKFIKNYTSGAYCIGEIGIVIEQNNHKAANGWC